MLPIHAIRQPRRHPTLFAATRTASCSTPKRHPGNSRRTRQAIGNTTLIAWAWWIGQWPLLIFGLLAAFAIVLYLAPNVSPPKWSFISPGAIFAVLVWLSASALFAVHASQFAYLGQPLRRHRHAHLAIALRPGSTTGRRDQRRSGTTPRTSTRETRKNTASKQPHKTGYWGREGTERLD
jgi:hypothetical protein